MSERTSSGITRGKGPQPAQVKVDPYDSGTYMRFVAAAAVDLLGAELGYTSRSDIALHAFTPGMKPSNLSAQLAKAEGPTPDFLGKLERQYLYRQHPLHNGAPWLTSFHEELHRANERENEEGAGDPTGRVPDVGGAARHEPVRIPIGWFYNLAQHPPRNSTEAFVQGYALRAFLSDARQATDAAKDADHVDQAQVAIKDLLKGFRLTAKAKSTVDALLEVVAGPPHTGLPAVRLVASFGELALGQVEAFIGGGHPAGFRAVRILGRILSNPRTDPALVGQVEPLLRAIHKEEPPDPYPARSLIVEALRFAPRDSAEWGWVTKALEDRTEREDRPTRERVYAAYVLFSRGHHAEARKVMEAFKESSDEGLKYAAAFLDVLFKRVVERVGTPYPWPHGRSESAIVAGATKVLDDDLEVPYSVRGALRQMVQGALLTIDGTARRSICEAIQAAGLGSSAVNGLISVMQDEASPPWLVEHAAFITGYLQTGYPRGAGKAVAALAGLAEDVTRLAPVRHAALWGIGDVVGSLESIGMLRTGWPETVPAASDAQASPRLEQLLAGLVDECSRADQNKPEVRRAATYTAAMLARRCAVTKRKPNTVVSQVLDRLLVDDDALVRELAKWGRRIEAARLHNSYLASTEPDPSDAG